MHPMPVVKFQTAAVYLGSAVGAVAGSRPLAAGTRAGGLAG
ncbi:hypothetical protein [Streptomyces sp. NPDC014734]